MSKEFELKKVNSNQPSKKYEKWKQNSYAKSVEKKPERKKNFTTASFSPVKELYVPEDTSKNYDENLSYPGEFPFTRGIQPTMYRGRFWTMRQERQKNQMKDIVIY
jgi:methylmalonyl-CoA mutase N-terminal domain/subunit